MVRIELLFAAYERYESSKIALFLLTFGQYAVSRERSLLRGDVIGPEKPVIPGVRSDSVYCALPVMFNPGLATFSESVPPTVFVWLMPITNLEADFVRARGWNAFEDCLARYQPDFWDMDRPSLAEIRPAS
jgi:Suppressor of fused protein (SUFU)